MSIKNEDSLNKSKKEKRNKVQDLEIKDPNLIFNAVWEELVESVGGEENLQLPKEIFWLNGAPGAGKGTHTRFIMRYKELYNPPIVISELLKSEDARKRMDAGLLVGDKEVTSLLFHKLLNPIYSEGAIVDGYPRTQVQVECLKLFYNKLNTLRVKALEQDEKSHIRRSRFHIIVLFIDEDESVNRQLARGRQSKEINKGVTSSGMGSPISVRQTDLDEAAARNRYRTFKEVTYDSLKSLREVFHYHYINALGSIKEIQDRILEELRYQSSLELDHETFDSLSPIPIASEIVKQARQQLVNRLDNYQAHYNKLFRQVLQCLQEKFMPIVKRHAISGSVSVNTEDPLFDEPMALAMLIDIFSERGYRISVDVRREQVPISVDLKTGAVKCQLKKVYRVNIRFAGSVIRRGS